MPPSSHICDMDCDTISMAFELRKADRKKARLRIGLAGPSGSGKTYSALLMASGIAPWDKIALIDTENHSGDLYAHLGAYNVIELDPPFEPEKYVEAIRSAEAANMEVIIVDSVTHVWEGEGGTLEIVDRMGGKFQDWGKATPRYRKFINAILQNRAHMICAMRSKQDYAMESGADGKIRVEKLGLKPVIREGFEYEMTIAFDIDIHHLASTGKDRTSLFMDKAEFIITEETGKALRSWADEGIDEHEEKFKELKAMLKQVGRSLKFLEEQIGKSAQELTISEMSAYIGQMSETLRSKHIEDHKNDSIPVVESDPLPNVRTPLKVARFKKAEPRVKVPGN